MQGTRTKVSKVGEEHCVVSIKTSLSEFDLVLPTNLDPPFRLKPRVFSYSISSQGLPVVNDYERRRTDSFRSLIGF